MTRILIVGGGIAGNALALTLARNGLVPTVVERAAAPRPGGQAVDLRGPSRDVAERMGIMPGIRRRQLDEKGMSYVDATGKERVRMPAELFGGNGGVAEIEITRGDLNQVLLDELPEDVDYRYGDRVVALDNTDVTFASGLVEEYDVIVGADGVHSSIRTLAFGPESDYATYLGGYMSFFTMPTPDRIEPGWFTLHSIPGGLAAGIRADADPTTAKALLAVRMPAGPELRNNPPAQRRLIRDRFSGAGWAVPQILAALDSADDLYFDELVRIDMPRWSSGRVVLLGDAGYCGSPLTGHGTAMALVGAYILAGELLSSPDCAFDRYEAKLRPFVAKAQRLAPGGLAAMAPRSRLAIRMGWTLSKILSSRMFAPLTARMLSRTDDYVLPEYAITPTVGTPPSQ
jgi:2-polyprenyl-6-methoxyphenol hydroxylase-like FAD-dependent oxidoreductase